MSEPARLDRRDAAGPRASGSGTCSRGSRWSRRGCARWSSTGARDDPAPDDPFRGLYLTDDDVDRLLAAPRTAGPPRDDGRAERRAGRDEPRPPAPSRLRRAAARRCGLTDLDVELLLVALAPDLDARFERLYGYLNDDVTRRRATVGLALELGAARPTAAAARGPAGRGAPLVAAPARDVEEPTGRSSPAACGCRTGWPRTCSAPTTRTPR